MNINDYLIIYLACGAPFGVYYFFDKRNSFSANRLWFRTFLIFLFWIPFALQILVKNKKELESLKSNFAKESKSDSEPDNKIISIQKELEKILLKTNTEISIYEFREVAERYIGLTFAEQNVKNITGLENMEGEIYKVSESENIKISTICFNRRNRIRLSFHQKNARQDFIYILERLLLSESDKINLGILSNEFVKLLNDREAQKALSKMFSDFQQTNLKLIVKNTENELWKPGKHKPLPASQLSMQFQTLTATTNLRKKD